MFSKLVAFAVAVVMIAGVTIAHAAEPQTQAANAAVQYIEPLQNADGGFPAFGAESTPGSTLDAVFALVAAGVDPPDVTRNGNSPADYLAAHADTYSVDAGGAAKLTIGVALMGLDLHDFGGSNGGLDMPSVLEGHLAEDPSTGVYGLDLFDQSLYILALAAADLPVRPAAFDYLRSTQLPDGGWEFSADAGSDSNTTAMALQALLAAGGNAGQQATRDALAFFATVQNDDGGFGFLADADSDPNSTALVLQALVAAGQNIDAGGPWDRGGHTPLDALLSFRNAATGAFQYGGVDSAFATYQAVPALMLAPFPDLQTRIAVEPTPTAASVVTVGPMATPQPMLPGAGGPSRGGAGPWWPVAALATGGAVLVAAGAVARRSR